MFRASRTQVMPVVHAKIHVAEDGSISAKAPRGLPPRDYQAPVRAPEAKPRRRRLNLPLHEAHWDDNVSLRREDIYGPDRR
jgi:hypothetical protein